MHQGLRAGHKLLAARLAAVRPLARVRPPHVHQQVGAGGEIPVAGAAGEGPLARVHAAVPPQPAAD